MRLKKEKRKSESRCTIYLDRKSSNYSNILIVIENVNFSIGKVHCYYFDEGDLNRSLESDINL